MAEPQTQAQGLGIASVESLAPALGIFGNSPAVPSSDLLIALRLLKDAAGVGPGQQAFQQLAVDELKWLNAGLAMVKSDPFLRIKMGGDNLTAAVNLAGILRSRAEAVHFQARIDEHVKPLVKNEFGTRSMRHIQPLEPATALRGPIFYGAGVAPNLPGGGLVDGLQYRMGPPRFNAINLT